jgi:hypothetical protein
MNMQFKRITTGLDGMAKTCTNLPSTTSDAAVSLVVTLLSALPHASSKMMAANETHFAYQSLKPGT